MKAQILKIAGVKSEKEFYKKYKTEADFMKVHGKAFKKAQTGAAISKAQNWATMSPGGSNDWQNSWEEEVNNTQNNSYGSFAPGNYSDNDIDNNGVPDLVQRAEGNPLIDNSSEEEQKKKPFDTPGAMNFISGIKDAGDKIKAAEAETKHLETWAKVSDVQKRANISNAFVPEQPREYYQPDALKNIYAANELGNTKGRGTDVIGQNGSMIGGNPTELQNMYSNEITLYDDLEYEPFRDSQDDNVKAYQGGSGGFGNMLGGGGSGGSTPFLGGSALGQGGLFGGGNGGGSFLAGSMGGNSSWANAASMIPGPVGMFATMAAQMFDPNPGKQRNAQNKINSNNAFSDRLVAGRGVTRGLSNMGVGQNGQNLEMYEEGGYMNPEYNPQVITMFGDHNAQDFADYAHKDQYRAGGHLKAYTPPSNRAMEIYEDGGGIKSHGLGGELQIHWGGGAETISHNPYLPGTGETVMFRGKSHEEYSPNGETGIGVTYGGNPVEVERREPMVELEEGGTIDPETGEVQKSGVVFGNLKIPNQYIDLLGDPNAKDKKFKTYVGVDLYKQEKKRN